jgi:hypothetical protein
MPRPQDEAYGLTDAEKRDLIAPIQAGKPIPDKYRGVGRSRESCEGRRRRGEPQGRIPLARL